MKTDNIIEIDWQDELQKNEESEALIRKAAEAVFYEEDFPHRLTVSINIVDGEEIRELNRSFRDCDKVTDVLSFPNIEYTEDYKPAEEISDIDFDPDYNAVFLGDMVICIDRAKEQAEEYGHSVERELAYLTVHSMYHLFGYDHMEEKMKKDMRTKEEKILKELGLKR